jgi:hypothetical protein
MAITTLPPAPQRTDPDNFNSKAAAFVDALAGFVTDANLGADVVAKQTLIAASETAASASAAAAATSAAAPIWVSGTTYTIGAARWSPANGLVYRRITAGAGTTDPSADATNWSLIVTLNYATGLGIGIANPKTGFGWSANTYALGIAGNPAGTNDAYGLVNLYNARTTPVTDDLLGVLAFNSLNNTAPYKAAIAGMTQGAGGATGGFGGKLLFYTKPNDNVSSVVARWEIDSTGQFGVAGFRSTVVSPVESLGGGLFGSSFAIQSYVGTDVASFATSVYANNPSSWRARNTATGAIYEQIGGTHNFYQTDPTTVGSYVVLNKLLTFAKGMTTALQNANQTAGCGIAFPVTQVASSDPNTLDDYEEGTWTPSLGGTATYTVQSGSYTKTGRVVHINCSLTVNVLGTGAASQILGLPFAAASGLGNFPLTVGSFSGAANSFVSLCGELTSGQSSFFLYSLTAAATGNTVVNVFTAGTQIRISGFYITT